MRQECEKHHFSHHYCEFFHLHHCIGTYR